MQGVDFPQANFTFGKPSSATDEQCGSLRVYKGVDRSLDWPVVVSCWQLSPEELEQVQQTGKIYIRMYTEIIPPIGVDTVNPVGVDGVN